MRKLRIVKFLLIFLCVFIVFFNIIFNLIKINNLNDFFTSILNGEENHEVRELNNWGINYLSENFYLENEKFILLDDVKEFEDYCTERIEIDKLLEDNPFITIEDDYSFYSSEVYEKDSRLKKENNQYYMFYEDIDFSKYKNYDVITDGHFKYEIYKENLVKKIKKQDQSVVFVSKGKEDGRMVYVYYDKDTKETIKIAINTVCGFIISCEII